MPVYKGGNRQDAVSGVGSREVERRGIPRAGGLAERERLSLPAFIRLRGGLPAWMARGSERSGRENQIARREIRDAIERIQLTLTFSPEEMVALREKALVATGILAVDAQDVLGLSVGQYIHRAGLSRAPAVEARQRRRQGEMDDAWERLQRLGSAREKFFPEQVSVARTE